MAGCDITAKAAEGLAERALDHVEAMHHPVALADTAGALLSSLLLPIVYHQVVFDVGGVALVSLGALVMVAVVTLPAVHRATAPAELRSE